MCQSIPSPNRYLYEFTVNARQTGCITFDIDTSSWMYKLSTIRFDRFVSSRARSDGFSPCGIQFGV
jgi:hypothetical protein